MLKELFRSDGAHFSVSKQQVERFPIIDTFWLRNNYQNRTEVAVRPYATFLELPTTIRGSKRIAKKGSLDTAAALLLQHQVIFYKFVNLKIQSLRNLSSPLLMHSVVKTSRKVSFAFSCGLRRKSTDEKSRNN